MSENGKAMAAVGRLRAGALVVGAIGLVLCVVGGLTDRAAFFQSWLFAYVFWVGLSLGSFGMVLLHHTVHGRSWGRVILRPLEAGARTIPLMGLLFAPIVLFGMQDVFPWARPEMAHDAVVQAKRAYLNVPFFAARWILLFAIWWLVSSLLNRWSLEQDRTGNLDLASKRANLAAPSIVLHVALLTFATTDWVMSIEPHWFSTIIPFLFLVNQCLSATALMVLFVMTQAHHRPLSDAVNPVTSKDLGNMLQMLVMLWGYLSVSQYLLIYSGNLPEEIGFYLGRMRGGWWYLATVVAIGQFFVPFLALLSGRTKRTPWMLAVVSAWVIAMRILNVYWYVVAAYHPGALTLHWTAVAAFAGIGGAWLAVFAGALARHGLLPRHEPRAEEAVQYA